MRKLLLFTGMATFIAITAQAQINKGTILGGGNIGGSTYKSTSSNSGIEEKQRLLNLSPSIGIATKNNTVWGLNLAYSSSGIKYNNETENHNYNRYGGSVFYRRYATLGKGFYLFGEANAGYSYSKLKEYFNVTGSRTRRTDMVSLSLHPGIAYAVHKNFHLEVAINDIASLSYSNQKVTTVENSFAATSTTKGLSFNTNISNSNPINVGFRFALGK